MFLKKFTVIVLFISFNCYSQHSDHQCSGLKSLKFKQHTLDQNKDLEEVPEDGDIHNYESRPGSKKVIYLDFDGEYLSTSVWSDNPINAQPAYYFSESEQLQICKMVAADFEPFDVNITSSKAVYDAAEEKEQVIFTKTNSFIPGALGVAEINTWNYKWKVWVFNSFSPQSAAGTASHEIGHVLGLHHDGIENGEQYYDGHGNWAPIMGWSGREKSQWSNGDYPNANNTQDDIGGISYHLDFIPDDFSSDFNNPVALPSLFINASGVFESVGLISNRSDKDIFLFETQGGKLTLDFGPKASGYYSNLRLKATIYDLNMNVIWTHETDEPNALNEINLPQGAYYLEFDGVGYLTPSTGYSDYGSVGEYEFSGMLENSSNEMLDLSVIEIENLGKILCTENVTTKFTVKNTGLKLIESGYNIIIYDDKGIIFDQYYDQALASGEMIEYEIEVEPNFASNWNFTAEVNRFDDDNPSNNALQSNSTNYYHGIDAFIALPLEIRGNDYEWSLVFENGEELYARTDFEKEGFFLKEKHEFCIPRDSCYQLTINEPFSEYLCKSYHDSRFEVNSKPFNYEWQLGDTALLMVQGGKELFTVTEQGMVGIQITYEGIFPNSTKVERLICEVSDNVETQVTFGNATDIETIYKVDYSKIGESPFTLDTCLYGLSVNTNEITSPNEFVLFPNPTNGTFTIQSSQNVGTLNIFDCAGRLVHTEMSTSLIDISNLEAGAYIVAAYDIQGLLLRTTSLIKR